MKTNIHTNICVLCESDSRCVVKYTYINFFNVHIENKFFPFPISAVNQPTPVLFHKRLTLFYVMLSILYDLSTIEYIDLILFFILIYE